MKLRIALMTVPLICLSASCETKESVSTVKVAEVEAEIQAKGARAFNRKYPCDETREPWQSIYSNIEAGNDRWLQVGKKLQLATDAGCSIALEISLGKAIKKNPKGVLHVLGELKSEPGFPLAEEIVVSVCSAIPPNDLEEYNPTMDIRDLRDRAEALQTLKAPSLESIKHECVRGINAEVARLQKILRKKK